MVQFYRGSEDPRDKAYGKLAEALGGGIGDRLNTYFANKSLDEATSDEKLKDAPLSEKWKAIQKALSPYGQKGQQMLQQRMAIEMQELQEKQAKEAEIKEREKEERLFQQQKDIQLLKNEGKKTPIGEREVNPQQIEAMQKARSVPGFNEMSESEQYRTLVDHGVSTQNAIKEATISGQQKTRESQEIERSFKANESFINDTTNAYKSFETEFKPRLLQMRNFKDEDLISPTAAVFLDALGIPLGALDDPSSELFQKLSQDLLKGLPETYGSRILKVEVENFLKTIPQLINSPNGRRMIASNMLKLGEMKEVYYNAMRNAQTKAIDSNKPLPRDFQQAVFDQVKPQIDRINNEFIKLSEIKSVPKDKIPFFNPNGDIEFVPKEHAQWASENGGRRIW